MQASVNQRFLTYLGRRFVFSPFSGPYMRVARVAILCIPLALSASQGGAGWIGLLISAVIIALVGAPAWRTAKTVRRMRATVRNGVPVTGVLVQANEALFRQQSSNLPALLLISFDPAPQDLERLERLARRMGEIKGVEQADPDLAAVSQMVTDERAETHRRRRLPASFTGGPEVYCADIIIRPSYLKEGRLTSRYLPVIAEPGSAGGIELVPWWIAAGLTMPHEARRTAATQPRRWGAR